MGLGATFWSGGGESIRWTHDWSNLAAAADTASFSGWVQLKINEAKLYQEPLVIGAAANASSIQSAAGFNAGHFYALETTSGQRIICDGVFPLGVPTTNPLTNSAPWVELEPLMVEGDLYPRSSLTPLNSTYYKTGFIRDRGVYYAPFPWSLVLFAEKVVGQWLLYHYNPYAWVGTPPGVIAAAAMKAGIPAEFIDQTGFDDAHDAYDLSTGDSPWSDLDTEYTLYARRQVGVKVSDFLLDVARHARDLIYVNEAGKLACSSWTAPTYTVSSFGFAVDDDLGIIGEVSWTNTLRHTFNSVAATWGAATRHSGDYGTEPENASLQVSREEQLESNDRAGFYKDEDVNTGSRTKFGTIWLKGRESISAFQGKAQKHEIAHYPYVLTPHDATWPAAGGLVHLKNWLTSDGKTRHEIEFKQGPRGFDFGVGDLLSNVAITGDGETISEARCIEKEYNFDDLTVRSVLLEVPSNS